MLSTKLRVRATVRTRIRTRVRTRVRATVRTRVSGSVIDVNLVTCAVRSSAPRTRAS